MKRPQRPRFDREQLRITPGAALLLGLEVGMTLVWAFLDPKTQASVAPWIIPTGASVWRQGHVWTLATGPLLEPDLLGLLLIAVMLWGFMPALERWWGKGRFLRFAAYTSLAATVAGTLFGFVIGSDAVPIVGLGAFTFAATVAFGIIYARQPVQLFTAIPMTGRQLMYGFMAFGALLILLQREWEQGAAYAAAMGLAAVLTNQRWNPRLAWLRWKKKRERAHLSVLVGGKVGAAKGTKAKKKPEQWLN